MNLEYIRKQIDIFDANTSINKGKTPPSSWYISPDFLNFEEKTVFQNNWLYVGRTDQLPKEGSYFCGKFLSQPYIVTRDKQGTVRAFFNVCRHHAACVATGEGQAEKFICPYHSWTYSLSGDLIHAPRLDGIEDFAKENYGLVPIQVKTWGPFIFLFFGKNPWPLSKQLAKLDTMLQKTKYEKLHFVKRVEYTIDCNWKVFVDSYLDGGYHVPYLHKGLASQLDLKNYNVEIYDRYSVQLCNSREDAQPQKGDFSERVKGGAIYAWLYPNFMINRYGPIMDINWVVPIDHEKTVVVFDYFFEETNNHDFICESIHASDIVQKEDLDICKSVQSGLSSQAYDQGRYAPLFEETALHFHKLLHRDFSENSF